MSTTTANNKFIYFFILASSLLLVLFAFYLNHKKPTNIQNEKNDIQQDELIETSENISIPTQIPQREPEYIQNEYIVQNTIKETVQVSTEKNILDLINCEHNQIPKFDAVTGIWKCANDISSSSSGSSNTTINTYNTYGGGGIYVGKTSGYYDGNIVFGSETGYKATNQICDDNFPESHMCQTYEILNTIASEDISSFSGTAWIAEGPPGYLADANDCMGFTDNRSTSLGSFWEFLNTNGGRGWLVNCSVNKQIACCK